jgi:hypothetical protein
MLPPQGGGGLLQIFEKGNDQRALCEQRARHPLDDVCASSALTALLK